MFPKTFEHQTTKVQNLLPKPRQTSLVFSLWWFINVVFYSVKEMCCRNRSQSKQPFKVNYSSFQLYELP